MVTVTVPATSANVGAGFDSLGLAVSMHNVFTFEESDRIQISSVDGTHVPAGSNNLVYRSARVVYDQNLSPSLNRICKPRWDVFLPPTRKMSDWSLFPRTLYVG